MTITFLYRCRRCGQIEKNPKHFATAVARIQRELAQGDWIRDAPAPALTEGPELAL